MARIVITGGAGFIGSHLCDYLLKKGHEIICIDNLITGDKSNITHLIDRNQKFTFIEQDVTNFLAVDGEINFVLHLASPASPIDYAELPIQTLKVGSLGTHNALGLAKAKKASFLLASTSEVYGDPLEHPQREDYWGNVNPVGPRGVYDEAKRFAEAMTMAYHRIHKIEVRIARIFNTYGPRMRINDGRAIPTFLSQALRHQDLTVFGGGNQTRSFCYISDLIEGLYKLLRSDINEPINLGNPLEMTVLELAQRILDITKSKGKIIFHPLPEDDPKVRQPDITKSRTLLGWEPKIGLSKGLKQTIDYFIQKIHPVS
jgi:dTDP-glucose 4,6-dehydratase